MVFRVNIFSGLRPKAIKFETYCSLGHWKDISPYIANIIKILIIITNDPLLNVEFIYLQLLVKEG